MVMKGSRAYVRCYRMVRKDAHGRDVFTKVTDDEKAEVMRTLDELDAHRDTRSVFVNGALLSVPFLSEIEYNRKFYSAFRLPSADTDTANDADSQPSPLTAPVAEQQSEPALANNNVHVSEQVCCNECSIGGSIECSIESSIDSARSPSSGAPTRRPPPASRSRRSRTSRRFRRRWASTPRPQPPPRPPLRLPRRDRPERGSVFFSLFFFRGAIGRSADPFLTTFGAC